MLEKLQTVIKLRHVEDTMCSGIDFSYMLTYIATTNCKITPGKIDSFDI